MSKDKINNGFNTAAEVEKIRESLKSGEEVNSEEIPQMNIVNISEDKKEKNKHEEIKPEQSFRERMENKLNTKTPLDMKKYLISTGVSMGFGLTPLIVDRLKNKDNKAKISKKEIFDFACYNIPALIPLIDQASKGTIFERVTCKAKIAFYAAPLIPVAKDLFDKGGMKKENINFDLWLKTVPFFGNLIVPKIMNDTSIIASIAGLATTFGGPVMMLFMSKTKNKEQIQKISSTASLVIGGLNGINQMMNKQQNANQINNTFGASNYNQQFRSPANQVGNNTSLIAGVSHFINNFAKTFNGNVPGSVWAGNSVYGSQNRYWNNPI